MNVIAAEPAWKQVEHLRSLGHHEAARHLAEHVLSDPGLDDDANTRVMAQLIELAGPVADLYPGGAFTRITAHIPTGWAICNPSIHPTSPELRAFVRYVNYRYQGPHTVTHDSSHRYRSRPAIATFAPVGLRTIGMLECIDSTGVSELEHYPVQGYEDLRLFEHGGVEYAVASVRNLTEEGRVQQALLTLNGPVIESMTELSGPDEGHQKNWMPVIGHEEMLFVDSTYPKRIRRHDPATGTTTITVEEPSDRLFSRFRGGSQLVPWRGGYLALVHEVMLARKERLYYHRFIQFDDQLDITHCSDQFFLAKRGIEFVAGLRHEGDSVIVSFGIDDRHAFLATIPDAEVAASMRPIAERTSAPASPQRSDEPSVADVETRVRAGIASTTLAHNGREAALAEALRSVVDHVDFCVVINTGTSDEIDRIAREIAGEKAIVHRLPWENDFAAARNASLDLAAETGAEWALIVDSDEQIHFGDLDISAILDQADASHHSFTTTDLGGAYTKARFFRLPVTGRYIGRTHEYFDTRGKRQGFLNGVRFSEREKDEGEHQHKIDRDLDILLRETRRRPMETRWWYYLGDALYRHKRYHEAIEAFRTCTDLRGWNEEAAWACYKEAQSWIAIKRYDMAVERCAVGIGIHPGVAELPWLAAWSSWKADKVRDAIHFANLAIVHGEYLGLADEAKRVSFRHLPALYEGPFDVLRFAYRKQGDTEAADQAERDFQQALAQRNEKIGLP